MWSVTVRFISMALDNLHYSCGQFCVRIHMFYQLQEPIKCIRNVTENERHMLYHIIPSKTQILALFSVSQPA